jgi:hypothetical protein
MKRSDRFLIFSFAIFLIVIFAIRWLWEGILYWPVIGVAIIFPLIIYLTSRRWVQKIIGEYPHPERGRVISSLSWGLGAVMILVLTLFILDQLNQPEVDYKKFIVFLVVPILLPIVSAVMKIPDVTKKTKTGSICVIKKLATSTVLFIIFIPLFTLTNKLNININSAPDLLHGVSYFRGFIGWSMVFCFYTGLLLFIFAVIDFVLVIKDLSTRKPRKTKKASKTTRKPNDKVVEA